MTNHGLDLQARVGSLLQRTFLADFVATQPLYRDARGITREAADHVVIASDFIIAIQVRSRQLDTDFNPDDVVEIDRIRRRISAAVDQVRTIDSAIKDHRMGAFTNLRGRPLPLLPEAAATIHGLVIIGFDSTQPIAPEQRLVVAAGVDRREGIPIHVFSVDDFSQLLSEFDTPSDLRRYLEVRHQLHERGIVFPLTQEKDLMGIVKVRWDVVADCLAGKVDHLLIDHGFWDELRKEQAHMFEARDRRLKKSRLIDELIERVHSSVGLKPPLEILDALKSTGAHEHVGTETTYALIALEIGGLSRVERDALAELAIMKAKKAITAPSGYSYCAYRPAKNRTAFLFLSSRQSREQRVQQLAVLSAALFVHLCGPRVVGIATEPADAKASSFEFVYVDRGGFADEEALREFAKKSFRPEQGEKRSEWGKGVPEGDA